MSDSWKPARGLREGCSTSPVLFNVYHQAVMRQAERSRGEGAGVTWRWVPGGSFAGAKVWEKGDSHGAALGYYCSTISVSGTVQYQFQSLIEKNG